jgi:uncharacterized membrane protein
MKKKYLLIISFLFLFLLSYSSFFLPHVQADPPDQLDYKETYNRGKILTILQEGMQLFHGAKTYNETLRVQLLEGREKGKIVTIGYSSDASFGIKQRLGANALVVIDSKPDPTGKTFYLIYEPYRLSTFWWILGIFLLFLIAIVGKKGIGALIGLSISLLTILFYIMPHILKGEDPLTVCVIGAIVILFVTLI